MSKGVTAYAAESSAIVPGVLYTYAGFIRVSGFSKNRIRDCRLQGLPLPTISVGRRLYVEGEKGIEFIKAAAELPSNKPKTDAAEA